LLGICNAPWRTARYQTITRSKLRNGIDGHFSFNEASTLQRHKRYYSALQYVHSGAADKGAYIQRLLKANFPKRPAQNPIEVHARGVRNPQLLSIAENVVYDSFFMMNIAAPSSCNFYRAMLLGDKIEPNVSLSHHAFESLHLYSGCTSCQPSSVVAKAELGNTKLNRAEFDTDHSVDQSALLLSFTFSAST
jgi:hypothetical protein